jgi:hypothetical protein
MCQATGANANSNNPDCSRVARSRLAHFFTAAPGSGVFARDWHGGQRSNLLAFASELARHAVRSLVVPICGRKKVGNGLQIVGGIGLLLLYFLISIGCDPTSMTPRSGTRPSETAATNSSIPTTIVMGSFSIQDFGVAKLNNPAVAEILVDVVRRFDILAVQELCCEDQGLIPRFVEMVNADGSRYKFLAGPRQGYTLNKEQYVYLYDSEKMELIGQPYIAPVPAGEVECAPLVAQFRCLNVPSERAFTFKLINVRVNPAEVVTATPTLANIIAGIEQYDSGEDDLILIGNVGSPPRYFQNVSMFPNQFAAIADQWATNTRQDLNLDNIVFDGAKTNEFLARSGVLNLLQEYDLSYPQALQVSDHLPVWAVFSTTEAPQTLAERADASVWR